MVGLKLLTLWGKWRSRGDNESLSGTVKLPQEEIQFRKVHRLRDH